MREEADFSGRYFALKNLVHALEDENNMLALKLAQITTRCRDLEISRRRAESDPTFMPAPSSRDQPSHTPHPTTTPTPSTTAAAAGTKRSPTKSASRRIDELLDPEPNHAGPSHRASPVGNGTKEKGHGKSQRSETRSEGAPPRTQSRATREYSGEDSPDMSNSAPEATAPPRARSTSTTNTFSSRSAQLPNPPSVDRKQKGPRTWV